MLDINFIRENLKLVEHSTKEKGYKDIDFQALLSLDDQRKAQLQSVEELRKNRNEIAAKMKGGKPAEELVKAGRDIKEKLTIEEQQLAEIESKIKTILKRIPNIILEDVPLGPEENSVEIKKWGEPKSEGVDHLDFATARDWVDFERGAKVAGAKFYYLKGGLALLENALLQFGLKKVTEHGFTYMTVPDLVSDRVLEGCGFNPRTSDQSDEYYIEGEDLALIATAEMVITWTKLLTKKTCRSSMPAILPVLEKKLALTANILAVFSAYINSINLRCMLSAYLNSPKKFMKKFSASKKRSGKS